MNIRIADTFTGSLAKLIREKSRFITFKVINQRSMT
jgi:hypothetical protein